MAGVDGSLNTTGPAKLPEGQPVAVKVTTKLAYEPAVNPVIVPLPEPFVVKPPLCGPPGVFV